MSPLNSSCENCYILTSQLIVKDETISSLQQYIIKLQKDLLFTQQELIRCNETLEHFSCSSVASSHNVDIISHRQHTTKSKTCLNPFHELNDSELSGSESCNGTVAFHKTERCFQNLLDNIGTLKIQESTFKIQEEYKVWVGNVIPPITIQGLKYRFEDEFGEVSSIEHYAPQPYAYVTFKSQDAFYKAVKMKRIYVQGVRINVEKPRH
ncbi:20678_t:CDS:2 [Cetraspora pellucida]|uniref:20678_t:CDS:1 n=1 Tax=Cetraspora pellucida TaxID=1433469 RepID=A0A9N9IGX8_9GLOM|nr:20678_t:CDS:2 [Cetraspora pellucida]